MIRPLPIFSDLSSGRSNLVVSYPPCFSSTLGNQKDKPLPYIS